MDRFINTSIYITYLIIAMISILISYKVSIIMALIVVAIETVRIMAIYKKVYSVIMLVFVLNTFLIGYNSFKSQQNIDYRNNQVKQSNEIITNYISTKDLKANTLKDLKNGIQDLEGISIDWWLLVGVYLFLELSLIMLIIGINRQDKKISKPNIKSAKLNGTKLKEIKSSTNLEYVGSFRDYARINEVSVRKAEAQFKNWKQTGKLIKQDGKNFLKTN